CKFRQSPLIGLTSSTRNRIKLDQRLTPRVRSGRCKELLFDLLHQTCAFSGFLLRKEDFGSQSFGIRAQPVGVRNRDEYEHVPGGSQLLFSIFDSIHSHQGSAQERMGGKSRHVRGTLQQNLRLVESLLSAAACQQKLRPLLTAKFSEIPMSRQGKRFTE